jgi:hypothetical protein
VRIVPTKTHGALDYLTGAALLALPKALGLEEVPSSARPQACRRRGNRLQSADGLRDGVAKLLPMSVHLALDAASSALLASSPWPFGFARNGTRYWLQPVLVGAQEILAAATTKTR